MPGNFIKEDLRVAKTYRALQNAMTTLLKRRKFKQLTINDLCEEALTSRAAFYIHFKDKYDLLECWFNSYLKESSTSSIEEFICRIAYDHSKVMQNILFDADSETLEIFHNFIRLLLDNFFRVEGVKMGDFKYTLMTKFCGGGIFEIILSLLKNQYTQEVGMTKQYLHNLLENLSIFTTKAIATKE